MTDSSSPLPDRRAFLGLFGATGLASTLLPGVLYARLAAGAEITTETIKCAEEVAGVSFTDDQRQMMLANIRRQQQASDALHKITIDNSVAPAIEFDPVPMPVIEPDRLDRRKAGERPGEAGRRILPPGKQHQPRLRLHNLCHRQDLSAMVRHCEFRRMG